MQNILRIVSVYFQVYQFMIHFILFNIVPPINYPENLSLSQ